VAVLVELGALAEADDYREAAWTLYSRANAIDPANPVALTGLGNLLLARQTPGEAKSRYLAALAAAPDFAPAHQGLARCMEALGEAGAAAHWRSGFAGHAMVQRPAGAGSIPLLLLAAAHGGNVPCKNWIDQDAYAVTTLVADYFDARMQLPPHAIAVNAIGDAELCGDALLQASRILQGSTAPLINDPARVRQTTRAGNAARLRQIPGVVTPQVALLTREALRTEPQHFPLLLRSPGFHTGQNFVLVETLAGLEAAMAGLPGEQLLAIEYLNARGADGLARKYRAMFIGGKIYPLHFAASTDWKVHYFTSAMAEQPQLRAQEAAFLQDMPGVLGSRAMAALRKIEAVLGLDFAGIDFALDRNGSVIVFEANATMIIHPPDARDLWDYRRPAVAAAIAAAQAMLRRKIAAVS
jgi:glutathione synthase/RimK-type ligase-like ATP-grasp enzyme